MEQVLIKNEKYSGQYAAIKDFNAPIVIACGKDPKKVYEEAKKRDVLNQSLFLFLKKTWSKYILVKAN